MKMHASFSQPDVSSAPLAMLNLDVTSMTEVPISWTNSNKLPNQACLNFVLQLPVLVASKWKNKTNKQAIALSVLTSTIFHDDTNFR